MSPAFIFDTEFREENSRTLCSWVVHPLIPWSAGYCHRRNGVCGRDEIQCNHIGKGCQPKLPRETVKSWIPRVWCVIFRYFNSCIVSIYHGGNFWTSHLKQVCWLHCLRSTETCDTHQTQLSQAMIIEGSQVAYRRYEGWALYKPQQQARGKMLPSSPIWSSASQWRLHFAEDQVVQPTLLSQVSVEGNTFEPAFTIFGAQNLLIPLGFLSKFPFNRYLEVKYQSI